MEIQYTGKVIRQEDALAIIEKYSKGDSLMKLSNEFTYNIATIRYFLRKNGVKTRTVKESVKPFHKKKEIKSDVYLHENLIGWLLGDGGLRICKKAINPYFNYTDKKYDHIMHVKRILDSYNIYSKISQAKISKCYRLQTESLAFFHPYYDLFYGYKGLNENGQKRKILPDIEITPLILLNWYVGDGSSCKQQGTFNNRGSISCKFKNSYILDQFNNLFGKVKCYNNASCFNYYFNNASLKKLLEYIGECPVESYKYKWIVRRNN